MGDGVLAAPEVLGLEGGFGVEGGVELAEEGVAELADGVVGVAVEFGAGDAEVLGPDVGEAAGAVGALEVAEVEEEVGVAGAVGVLEDGDVLLLELFPAGVLANETLVIG